jgi:hypothetical protein
MRGDAACTSEGGVTSLGIQMWVQLLNGTRMAFGHMYLTELSGFLQVLGNAYRLASTTDGGSDVVYGRFTVGFCRAAAARVIGAIGDQAAGLSVTRFD